MTSSTKLHSMFNLTPGKVSRGKSILAKLAGPRAPNPNAPPPRAFVPSCLPDAGLLRLCCEFQDLHVRSFAAPDDTNEWEVLLSRRWEVSAVIEGMTPISAAGRIAKAGVALVLLEENADLGNAGERFAVMALRDLVGSVQA